MNKVNVSTLKNNLSAVLRQVRRGAPVIVMDRDHPVAKISKLTSQDVAADEDLLLQELNRKGFARPPKRKKRVPVKELSAHIIHCKKSVVQALLEERDEARF